MRSSLVCEMSLTDSLSNVKKQIEKLLNEPVCFIYNYVDVLEQIEEDSDPICEWVEDPIVSYPDILSLEPVVGGETQLVVSVLNELVKIESSELIEDPTWKDILLQINKIVKNQKMQDIILYGFELTGLTSNGMGYVLEAVTYKIEQ